MEFRSDSARNSKGFRIQVFQRLCQGRKPNISVINIDMLSPRLPTGAIPNAKKPKSHLNAGNSDCLSDEIPSLATFLELGNKVNFRQASNNQNIRPNTVNKNTGQSFQHPFTKLANNNVPGISSSLENILNRGSRLNSRVPFENFASSQNFLSPSSVKFPTDVAIEDPTFNSNSYVITRRPSQHRKPARPNIPPSIVEARPNPGFPMTPEHCNWCKLYSFHKPYIINYSYSRDKSLNPLADSPSRELRPPEQKFYPKQEFQQNIYLTQRPKEHDTTYSSYEEALPQWIRNNVFRNPKFTTPANPNGVPENINSDNFSFNKQLTSSTLTSPAVSDSSYSAAVLYPLSSPFSLSSSKNIPDQFSTFSNVMPVSEAISDTLPVTSEFRANQLYAGNQNKQFRDLFSILKMCNQSIISNNFSMASPGFPKPSYVGIKCSNPIFR